MIGLIGKKIGMTQIFDNNGQVTSVSVIKIEPNIVIGQKNNEKNGYSAVVIGTGQKKEKHTTKAERGRYPEGIKPVCKALEFKNFDKECAIGETLGVDLFQNVLFVDVIGNSKGKGYQGVMRRHNFKGGRKTHGSKFHRAGGSTGSNTLPAHSFKGLRMAGRMGNVKRTVQKLRLIKIDTENQLLLIKGAVPGVKNNFVIVRKSIKF